MPRLFTALAVPPEIAEALAVYRGGLPGARWVEPADFHVTLRFLGDVERPVAEDFWIVSPRRGCAGRSP